VAVSDEEGRPVGRSLARWLSSIAPARARGTVHVALVSDRRSRTLNRTYRGIDHPTDVLSFPAEEAGWPEGTAPANSTRRGRPERTSRTDAKRRPDHTTDPPISGPRLLGDIVIAVGVMRRQARQAGHDEATELRVLALHGLLHLLGYDHERDAGRMARVERRLRRKGGLREGLIERR
jgi:probable rRNA maturation factor